MSDYDYVMRTYKVEYLDGHVDRIEAHFLSTRREHAEFRVWDEELDNVRTVAVVPYRNIHRVLEAS